MKFVRWVAVSQTESSRRPSISGGLFVRPMTAVGRPNGVGANPPPPPPVLRWREPASRAGAGSPAGPGPKASAPLTGRSGRAWGAAGGTAETTGGAGESRTAGADPAGTNLPGARRAGAGPADANLPGAGLPEADTGTDGPPAPVESRVASTAATSSCMSKRSATPPSTRVPNSTAPVATSTIRVVMRRASPTRCRVPSIIQATPCRR